MRGFINHFLSKLPNKLGGMYVENVNSYWLINPIFLRANNNIPKSIIAGQRVFDLLSVHVPLDSQARVLDVGCGDGRTAAAFARKSNNFSGTYFGFDINNLWIEKLNKLYKFRDNFDFAFLDMFHSYYNPKGSLPPNKTIFPCNASEYDVVIFNSIFSHMKLHVIEHNLNEAIKYFGKDGKIWATFYIIDDNCDSIIANQRWKFSEKYDQGFTATPETPEGCVAYNENTILNLFENIGLTVRNYIPGSWKMRRTTLDQHNQDIYVLSKKLT